MQLALILNLLGTVVLFYSFQATSSKFRLVTTKVGRSSLCVDGQALITHEAGGLGSLMGPCPDWANSKAAAVVNIEHPTLIGVGFLLITAGFLIQYFAIPQPKTIAQIRSELKLLKAQEKRNQNRT
jgi:uncharacterized membrane protein